MQVEAMLGAACKLRKSAEFIEGRPIGDHVDSRRACATSVSRHDLVTQKAPVAGKQFEVPHRIAQLELQPTALVIFEGANISARE